MFATLFLHIPIIFTNIAQYVVSSPTKGTTTKTFCFNSPLPTMGIYHNINKDFKVLMTTWIFVFIACGLFMYFAGLYNFCYREQWETFIYDGIYIDSILYSFGGIARLIANWFIQFFAFPIISITITAFLLSSATTLLVYTLQRITKSYHLLPLSLLLAASLMLLLYNNNCNYCYLISFVLMTMNLAIHVSISKHIPRYISSLTVSILLLLIAGPIATLYCCLVLIIELCHNWRNGLFYLSHPTIIIILALIFLQISWVGSWEHILLPDGYFTLRLKSGSSMYLPFTLSIVIFAIACIYRHFTLHNKSIIYTLFITEFVCVILFVSLNTPKYISRDNESFKYLNYLVRFEKWNDIIDHSKQLPMTNVLHQNIFNMALAEKERLSDEFLNYPNIGVQSLLISGVKNPYITAMLSDIYFSMGHIAFAQRYAFEANESFGNYSPKLLKRLALTSAIYDNKPLAIKYISLLEKTLFYRDWATELRSALESNTSSPLAKRLQTKKACLFPDNRFSGSMGIDKDLEEILKTNPAHSTTSQYLKVIQFCLNTK